MQKFDFVHVAYTAKIKEGGQVFDVSEPTFPLGAGFVIKGLDEALMEMNVGEKKTVEIPPEKAFGERIKELVKLVPESEFKKHNVDVKPGMAVDADNARGRVLSVASGRVTVDFNHPLAGKILVYDVELKEKIGDLKQKVESIISFFGGFPKGSVGVNESGKELEVTLPPILHPVYKKKIADAFFAILGYEKVKFAEVFEKPKPDNMTASQSDAAKDGNTTEKPVESKQ